MKRILVYENRKVDACYFDASTEQLEAGAYLALFKLLDESWQVYGDLKEPVSGWRKLPEGHPEGCMCEPCVGYRQEQAELPKREKLRAAEVALYKRAAAGEAAAARDLLERRKDGEYEEFRFAQVESHEASYPPRVWGVSKPCGEAFVAQNGVYRWGLHGRLAKPTKHDYGYRPTQKAAIEYLTKGRILRFDQKSRGEVDLGDEVWEFRPREAGWNDGEWMYRALCSEAEYAKTGIPILEQGSMRPGRVVHLVEHICSGCRRDMDRFKERAK